MRKELDSNIIMKNYWKKFTKKINKFLADLAEENKRSFGTGKLDCCQLNRDSTSKKRN